MAYKQERISTHFHTLFSLQISCADALESTASDVFPSTYLRFTHQVCVISATPHFSSSVIWFESSADFWYQREVFVHCDSFVLQSTLKFGKNLLQFTDCEICVRVCLLLREIILWRILMAPITNWHREKLTLDFIYYVLCVC